MTTIATLVTRVQLYLQDQDAQGWTLPQVETQLREVIARLGRQQLLGEVVWQQVVAGQPEYLFAESTVEFLDVLYDGRSLRPVQETSMSRLRRDWDQTQGEPQYFTVPLEPPETVKLIPIPFNSGDPTPATLPRPITGPVEGNLVVFLWDNPQAAGNATLALPEALEDAVVFLTVADLTGQDSPYHDKEKNQCFQTLGMLIVQQLLGE